MVKIHQRISFFDLQYNLEFGEKLEGILHNLFLYSNSRSPPYKLSKLMNEIIE